MKLASCLLFAMTALLCIPVSTLAIIDTQSLLYIDKKRVEEITQTTQEVNFADKTPVQLYDGKYFAFSPAVSVMFVKTGDSVKGLAYHTPATRGSCVFGTITNNTRMDVWEIHSLYVWRWGNTISIKFNGEEQSFDLEIMEVETKSQFEQHYKAMGYGTLWQDIWKEFLDCGNFFSILNI